MRRTYRSKKDTGGALDHRDVLLAVDEKTSAFDAFYIESLKQTKRELSCMGTSSQYKAVPNKVRKKKFVKRIIKDVENNPRESISRSTYLTPDKSIRLNKGHDLFDQLLNTSSSEHVDPKVTKVDSLIDKVWSSRQSKTTPKTSKTCTRKARKAKKYNYSSSESYETDKENESSNVSQNATDIRAHKLTVEKYVPSLKHQDESINNIVQNLSLLNSVKNMNNPSSPVISFSYVKKRTKQLQSTVIDNTILSSTPFKNIRTATSIYKFSPISQMNYGDRSNYVTITEENYSKLPTNYYKSSPVIHVNKTQIGNSRAKGKWHQILGSAMTADVSENSIIENNVSKETVKSSIDHNGDRTKKISSEDQQEVKDLDCVSVLSDSSNESFLKVSLGGSKPSEVFLGFTVVNNENDVSNSDKSQENDITAACEKDINDVSINPDVSEIGNESESVVSMGGSKPSEPFFGFNAIDNEMDVSLVSQMSEEIGKKNTSTSEPSVDSQDVESLYNTCNSEKNTDISNLVNEQPVVKIERMEDAIFQQYYEKMAAYASDASGDEDMDEDSGDHDSEDKEVPKKKSTALHTHSNNNDIVEKVEVDSDDYSNSDQNSRSASEHSNIETDGETVSPLESESDSGSMFEGPASNSNDDEEVRCFVNTRRRVSYKNNSNKLSLDTSSSDSSERNKTVLRNSKIIMNSFRLNEIQNEILVSDEDGNIIRNSVGNNEKKTTNLKVESINLDSDETDLKATDERISFVTTRKSSNKHSLLQKTPGSSIEVKPCIVLQPGKKWERSLSIYRRMTMMNDHFDRSVLEDDDYKGRKYRQSVISTMEMQEGSLHNESISSRRSTFVAKTCRSTIRILRETNSSRISLCNNTVYDDLKGFISDDCDDTIVELSKLSIADSGHEITVVDKLHEDRFNTARDYVLRRCNQTEAILFDECYPDTALKNCHKIGEGVYGEVFLWRARDGRARVMKIVPIAGTTKVNGENQKDFHEIISEIVIAMELSALRTPIADLERQFDEGKDVDALELHSIQNATDVFNEVLAVRCVYGSYTSRLLDLWELYDECKGSENDNPAILPSDQQYIVLELANAGLDLESYQFNSAEQAHALFLQVAFGLAVGEEAFQFEHRDLHWGNVLIAPTEQKYARFVLRGRSHVVPRCGVAGTIIDYSLSRLSLPLAPPPAGEAAALYNDLAADEGLFDAVGDYQFEVYRLMREKLGNEWKNFEPYTNILWLHYTVDKMITALRYKRTNTKIHKHYISKLKAIRDRILSYGSAVQFVLTDIEY